MYISPDNNQNHTLQSFISLGSILDLVFLALAVFHPNGGLVMANDEYCRLFGKANLPAQKLKDDSESTLISADNKSILKQIRSVIASPSNLEAELLVHTEWESHNGEKYIVAIFKHDLADLNEKGAYAKALTKSYGKIERLKNEIEALKHDINERMIIERQLRYQSMHDGLTACYNRFYFQEEMHRLENPRHNPVGIIVFDLDGLKLINDTLGHDKGDQLLTVCAQLISSCFRKEDVFARIGGDEFAVLLPRTPLNLVEKALQRVNKAVDEYNYYHPELPLSISAGFALRNNPDTTMNNLLKEADDKMYRSKVNCRQNTRILLLNLLMKSLISRDFIDKGHVIRIQNMVDRMALALNLSTVSMDHLQLLVQFHDVGKVGIPASILFKQEPLTSQELAEVQRHCEIGHRIALQANNLNVIADWILKHHEWWNGKGYPLGLKGEEIPLECRIFSIADAFDVMTSDRPYHKAMSVDSALEEIKKLAGIKFDPFLVDKFIELIANNSF